MPTLPHLTTATSDVLKDGWVKALQAYRGYTVCQIVDLAYKASKEPNEVFADILRAMDALLLALSPESKS